MNTSGNVRRPATEGQKQELLLSVIKAMFQNPLKYMDFQTAEDWLTNPNQLTAAVSKVLLPQLTIDFSSLPKPYLNFEIRPEDQLTRRVQGEWVFNIEKILAFPFTDFGDLQDSKGRFSHKDLEILTANKKWPEAMLLGSKVIDLFENYPYLIPKSWMFATIYFLGDIYYDPRSGRKCVRCFTPRLRTLSTDRVVLDQEFTDITHGGLPNGAFVAILRSN